MSNHFGIYYFPVKNPLDYQGRNFLHPPQDVGVNLKSDVPPAKCFLPKAHIHTWKGHTKGIAAIRWFPKTAHLLLSASMDCRVKVRTHTYFMMCLIGLRNLNVSCYLQLWEVYNERRCIRTYYGHRQAVRDICFNNDGTQFLSAGKSVNCYFNSNAGFLWKLTTSRRVADIWWSNLELLGSNYRKVFSLREIAFFIFENNWEFH